MSLNMISPISIFLHDDNFIPKLVIALHIGHMTSDHLWQVSKNQGYNDLFIRHEDSAYIAYVNTLN